MNNEDDSEFGRLMRGVKPLRNDRINVYQQRSQKKVVIRTPADTHSETDFRSPENGIANDTHFHTGLQKKIQRKIRQGAIRPESSVDLHGLRKNEAIDMLEGFIEDAIRSRMRMILIIHGQGIRSQSNAVLKPLVHRWLAAQPRVLAWCPALARDGAAGASYVYLRGS